MVADRSREPRELSSAGARRFDSADRRCSACLELGVRRASPENPPETLEVVNRHLSSCSRHLKPRRRSHVRLVPHHRSADSAPRAVHLAALDLGQRPVLTRLHHPQSRSLSRSTHVRPLPQSHRRAPVHLQALGVVANPRREGDRGTSFVGA